MQIRRKAKSVTTQKIAVPARLRSRLPAPAVNDAPEEIDAVHSDQLGVFRAAARADGLVADRTVLDERAHAHTPRAPQPVDPLQTQAEVSVGVLSIEDAAAVVSRDADRDEVLELEPEREML